MVIMPPKLAGRAVGPLMSPPCMKGVKVVVERGAGTAAGELTGMRMEARESGKERGTIDVIAQGFSH